ncbi:MULTISPECIES: hypothetical protein [unclassified Campylobacter]|uniref:hypothetical protein n=1 Tax=unclassified Campylobacter TaxID=2593542 RepID=UPI0012382DC8|nr:MULTISPECIES: hypothetical protein [unclassified Campylobacter]KAA6225203.1 hypothetical protein FMM55_07980 [Campylobacter sp. LR196d]KAA6226215.1 hypothetical protein FMM54_05355 [Campylobacter sp. LR185c]KAA6228984.1 hypothetical protein FMM57_01890 [Campylobacter sp. LR286c]KAA6231416.1 hypothetical protein FMM56_04505 [Campylobacter sp. LR264d]KAA6231628.1 hypothetical protein FMM58_03295 [Campylobacter sp. LR291e]
MSKPLNAETQSFLDTDLSLQINDRKNEILLQILNLLEVLKANEDDKMARISGELSELLEDEKNLKKITKTKCLDELLNVILKLNDDKMVKIYAKDYLKEKFPILAKSDFLK